MNQGFRHFLRSLKRRPGFVFFSVLTLALGIGANTALFSAVFAVVLKPLPYGDPERLAMLWRSDPRMGLDRDLTSYPNFLDWQAQGEVFEAMTPLSYRRLNITGGDLPERVQVGMVGVEFFDVLKLEPLFGRTFLEGDDHPGGERVAVLSHEYWQARYGGARDVLGQTLELDGRAVTIVGILPYTLEISKETSVWVPLVPTIYLRNARGTLWLQALGRLRPGVSLERAQATMDTVAQRLGEDYPGFNTGSGIEVVPLRDQVAGNARIILLVLLASVTFVLLIACTNVANLQLVRAVGREKEMAIRSALGAGRGRLVLQHLSESLWLALFGGLAGLGLAYLGLDSLLAFSPANVPRLNETEINGPVLLYTLALTLLTGLVAGLLPALNLSQIKLTQVLNQSDRRGLSGRAGHGNVRKLLVVAQVALALVLLIGAGLMMNSLRQLQEVEPGFDPEQLLTFQVGLPNPKYSENHEILSFFTELLDRLQVVPGVEGVGATSMSLVADFQETASFLIAGRMFDSNEEQLQVEVYAISPGYFETLGTSVLAGREFTFQDYRDQPPVVIINQAMAERFWPTEDPIGQRMKYRTDSATAPWITVVGVVENTFRPGLDRGVQMMTYRPHEQRAVSEMTVMVRTLGDPLELVDQARELVVAIDSEQPIHQVASMEQLFAEPIARQRFSVFLLGIFSAVALVLSVVGVYGVLSYLVAQNTREIGMRMALGAKRKDLLWMVIGQGLKVAFWGLLSGLLASWALTRWMAALLFDVSTTDPRTFLGLAVLLGFVVFLASVLPAYRATRVEPLAALRYE